MNELWKDISDFPGYQISNMGRVRSFKKKKVGQYQVCDLLDDEPHLMNVDNSDDGNGYKKIMLRKGGKSYCRKIHRLVAEAFIPNSDPDYYDTVDHISNDKRDNRAENLQWLSKSANISKAYSDGLHNKRIKNSMVPIWIEDRYTGQEFYFKSMVEAADFLEVDYTTISHNLPGSEGDWIYKDYVVRKLR